MSNLRPHHKSAEPKTGSGGSHFGLTSFSSDSDGGLSLRAIAIGLTAVLDAVRF